jgi:hypothetical protein
VAGSDFSVALFHGKTEGVRRHPAFNDLREDLMEGQSNFAVGALNFPTQPTGGVPASQFRLLEYPALYAVDVDIVEAAFGSAAAIQFPFLHGLEGTYTSQRQSSISHTGSGPT